MFLPTGQSKLTSQIVSQVRNAILSGKLQPGQRLPAEKEMLLQFGVSKHTLREALRALESMGFVEIRQGAGGGPVVSEIDMENTRDMIASFLYFKKVSVRDLCEVRKIFEPYLARMAAERFGPAELDKLVKLNGSYRKSLTRNRPAVKEEVEFHVLLAKSSGNPVLVMILDFVNSLLTDIKNHLKPGRDFSAQVAEAHQRIVDAIASGNGEVAAASMYDHACQVEQGLLDLMHREGKHGHKTSAKVEGTTTIPTEEGSTTA